MFPSQFLSLIQMPVAPEQKIKRYLISMKNVPLSIPGSDSDAVAQEQKINRYLNFYEKCSPHNSRVWCLQK